MEEHQHGTRAETLCTRPGEKVAVVGSRTYPRPQDVFAFVWSLPDDAIIVSGGAKGVDRWAETAARQRGLAVQIHLAEWDIYGKAAGFKRNVRIANEADRVVAYWDGKSKGTGHTIRIARKLGKPIEIYGLGAEL